MNELLDLILAPLGGGLADQVRQRFEVTRADPDLGEHPDTDELHALQGALQDFPDEYPPEWWLDPARCCFWLSLHVDWKAYDEVEWKVQAIARTLGLEVDFESAEAVEWDGYFDHVRTLGRAKLSAVQGAAPGTLLLKRLGTGLVGIGRAIRKVSWGEPLPPARQPPSDTPTMDVLGEASGWLRERGYELLYLDTGGDEYLAVPVRLDLLAQAQAAAERLDISTYLV